MKHLQVGQMINFISLINECKKQSLINTDTQKERICWNYFIFTFYNFELFMQQCHNIITELLFKKEG